MFSLFLSDARVSAHKRGVCLFLDLMYFAKSYTADHFVLTDGLNVL